MAAAVLGCEPSSDSERVVASGTAKDADLEDVVAQEPVVVSGSYLRCQFLAIEQRDPRSSVGCNPIDASNGALIDLRDVAQQVNWSVVSSIEVELSTNYEDDEGNLWQGRFDFSSVDAIDLILDTEITLQYLDMNQTNVTLVDRIRNILIELAAHRYVRIVYQSIHMNAPSESPASPDPVNFDLKIAGTWQPVEVIPSSIDFTAQTMASASMSFQFNGSPIDWRMYLSSGLSDTYADYLGDGIDILRWAQADGNAWVFDEGSSFAANEPYDLSNSDDLVYMDIDFGEPKTFHGFRIDQGLERPGRVLPNGFPDQFYFLYSDDGEQWQKIPGSESSMDGLLALSWEWD